MMMPSVVASLVAVALSAGGIGAVAHAQVGRAVGNNAGPVSAATAHGRTDSATAIRPAQAERRVDVTMKEMVFLPNTIDVKVGETVIFVFTNSGQEVHDAFIGDKAAQEEHERQMRAHGSGHQHEHEGGVTVAPGQTGELRYSFDKPGTLEIGCHQPNHYDSGMKAIITVAA